MIAFFTTLHRMCSYLWLRYFLYAIYIFRAISFFYFNLFLPAYVVFLSYSSLSTVFLLVDESFFKGVAKDYIFSARILHTDGENENLIYWF